MNFILVIVFLSQLSYSDGINFIGACDTPGKANEVFIDDNYAYVADHNCGLRVIDISNPSNPYEVGSITFYGNIFCVWVTGNYALVGSADFNPHVFLLNVSNPSLPYVIDSCAFPGNVYSIQVRDNYAYAAIDDGGLKVIDISNPNNIYIAGGCYTHGDACGLSVQGNYVYVGAEYFDIIDISTPTSPFVTSYYIPTGLEYATDACVYGDYAYVSFDWNDYDSSDSTLQKYSNFQNGGLRVFDVSTPENPIFTGYCFTSYDAFEVYYLNNYVVTADLSYGINLIDVSNPSNPSVEEHYSTYEAHDIIMIDTLIYVADGPAGLKILSYDMTIDTVSPVIDSTTVLTDTIYTGPFVIETYVTDNKSVDSVLLFYKRIEDPQFRSINMTQAGSNWYSGEIPSVVLQNDSVKYYIYACDFNSNSATDPVGAPGNYYSFTVFPDTVPPVIDSTTLWSDTTFWGPYLVQTNVIDESDVDSVCLFYKRIEDPEFRSVLMDVIILDWYEAYIPNVFLTEDSVKYYIHAWDVCGNTSTDPDGAPASFYSFFVLVDSAGPVIDSTTLWTDTSFSGPYPVYSKISDISGIDTFLLYYKRIEDVQFFSTAMIYQGSGWFSGDIPQVYLDDDSVKYYIFARDSIDNTSTDPDSAPVYFYSFVGRSTVGVEENTLFSVDEFSLSYTSPSNNKILFKLNIPYETSVSFKIYDLSGRIVEEFISGCVKPSVYQFQFNPSRDGIYFYRLETPVFRSSEKIIVF